MATDKKSPAPGVNRNGAHTTDEHGELSDHNESTSVYGAQYGMLLPKPPAKLVGPKWRVRPMTMADAALWIGRFNGWVDFWNFCEVHSELIDKLSAHLPISPSWNEAHFVCGTSIGFSDDVLGIETLDKRIGIFKLHKWEPFHDGRSMKRYPARLNQIVWAGWLEPDTKGDRNNG